MFGEERTPFGGDSRPYRSIEGGERRLTSQLRDGSTLTLEVYRHPKSGGIRITAAVDGVPAGRAVFDEGMDAYHARDFATSVEVSPGYRRRGVASAMYDAVEQLTGLPVRPASAQSPDARAFWNARRAARAEVREEQVGFGGSDAGPADVGQPREERTVEGDVGAPFTRGAQDTLRPRDRTQRGSTAAPESSPLAESQVPAGDTMYRSPSTSQVPGAPATVSPSSASASRRSDSDSISAPPRDEVSDTENLPEGVEPGNIELRPDARANANRYALEQSPEGRRRLALRDRYLAEVGSPGHVSAVWRQPVASAEELYDRSEREAPIFRRTIERWGRAA